MVESEDSYTASIFVGAATGLLKSIELGKRQAANFYGPDELEKNHEIQRMLLQDKSLMVAMKNGGLKRFDLKNRKFNSPVKLWKGKDHDWKGLYEVNQTLIGVSADGSVKSWSRESFDRVENENDQKFNDGNPNFYKESEILEEQAGFAVATGASTNPVKCSASRNTHLAVAGEETQLQIFDMNIGEKGCLFKAKSPPPDKLQLHIPLHFPSIALPDQAETVLASAYGSKINQSHEGTELYSVLIMNVLNSTKVRLYDPRATQRRPIKRIQWERHPITSICSLDQTGHKIACGNSRGKMMWVDFRQEKRIHPLKGPAGSVRSISRHPDNFDYVAAVGLDRHLYLFDTKTNSRKQKIYLKSQLNTVIIEPGAATEQVKEEEKKKEKEDSESEEEKIDDAETEKIWRDLEN